MNVPAWAAAGRKNSRWPREAMDEALTRLEPAASPQKKKMRGTTRYAEADVACVAAEVSAKYSNPHFKLNSKVYPIVCEIHPKTLRAHAKARDRGEIVSSAGGSVKIPQLVIDHWVGWIGLDATSHRIPTLNQALWKLWELCAAGGIEVPADWKTRSGRRERRCSTSWRRRWTSSVMALSPAASAEVVECTPIWFAPATHRQAPRIARLLRELPNHPISPSAAGTALPAELRGMLVASGWRT